MTCRAKRVGLEDGGLGLDGDVGVERVGGTASVAHHGREAEAVHGFFLDLELAGGLVAALAEDADERGDGEEQSD